MPTKPREIPADVTPGFWVRTEIVTMGKGINARTREMLSVVCRRCGKGFLTGASWRRGNYTTRPCPHCFKVSRVEADL